MEMRALSSINRSPLDRTTPGPRREGMSGAFRYKAFLSYSHADKRAAERLFNRLESYRLPRRLLDSRDDGAPRAAGLGVFFRDREELPASGDLGREVRQALSQSEFLIVLCSPDAARSQWVDKEIAEFKAMRGEGNILAAVIDGEPFAQGKPGAAECFPHSLRFRVDSSGALTAERVEPLAADFRAGRDGERLGFLKLVAALAGVELARLLDRDQERAQRRVTAVTLASLAFVVVMGALTLFAVDARRDAERQREAAFAAQAEAEARRNDAEGLIEFMLTDLREKLEPVGRLDALQVVADRAQDYYDAQDLGAMADDALARRARVFHLIGEIDERRGDLAFARRRWTEAAAATEALLARAPDDPQRIFDHAQSVFWVGRADFRIADREAAGRNWRLYRSLAERLIAAEPSRSRGQKEKASASLNLGTLHFSMSGEDSREAAPYFREALEGHEAVLRLDGPSRELSLSIATAHAWIADATVSAGPLAEALDHRGRQLAIYEALLEDDPDDFVVRARRVRAAIAFSQIETFLGRPEAALAKLASAQTELERLRALEPDDDQVRRDAITLSLRIADAAMKAGDLARAEAAVAQMRRATAQQSGGALEWEFRFALIDLAEIELALRREERARAEHLIGILTERLEARLGGERVSLHIKAALARALAHRAALAEEDGDAGTAASAHARVAALLGEHQSQINPATRSLLARAYAALGQREEARRIADAIRAQGYDLPETASRPGAGRAEGGEAHNAER
jgi:hypothetical protein